MSLIVCLGRLQLGLSWPSYPWPTGPYLELLSFTLPYWALLCLTGPHVWGQDKFCNCYTDDEGTGWGDCQDCADIMLTAYHKMTPTVPETCDNNANGFEGTSFGIVKI